MGAFGVYARKSSEGSNRALHECSGAQLCQRRALFFIRAGLWLGKCEWIGSYGGAVGMWGCVAPYLKLSFKKIDDEGVRTLVRGTERMQGAGSSQLALVRRWQQETGVSCWATGGM
eukprot:1222455-Rhodomonas_salina.1